jgi:uncharacterized tellurite resistance protein B-like protein
MEQISFNKLLLKTAFSCMACDGDIDPSELDLIRDIEKNEKIFLIDDFESQINSLFEEINEKDISFLKDYLSELENSNLTNSQELKIIEIAIKMIKADSIEQYSEIKFFKIMRSKLTVSNEEILTALNDIFDNLEDDYLSEDIISDSYLTRIQADYFNSAVLPKFDLLIK